MTIPLTGWSAMLGAVHIVAGILVWLWREPVHRALRGFPRNRICGGVLSALAVLATMAIVLGAHLGRYERLKPMVYVAGPLTWLGTIVWMADLLAPRALGAILLLICRPMLLAARLSAHPAARVVAAYGYLWVAAGMTLVGAPWQFRRVWDWLSRTPRRMRVLGLALLGIGLGFGTLTWLLQT